MSKHFVQHCTVMHDIETMSLDDLEFEYNIEVDADGFVWDLLEAREFVSLREWATFIQDREEEEPEEMFIPRAAKSRYED